MKCLECGHDIVEMHKNLVVCHVPEFTDFDTMHESKRTYSHTEHKGHCPNCLRDWEWEEIFKDGKVTVTQPTRIFWG